MSLFIQTLRTAQEDYQAKMSNLFNLSEQIGIFEQLVSDLSVFGIDAKPNITFPTNTPSFFLDVKATEDQIPVIVNVFLLHGWIQVNKSQEHENFWCAISDHRKPDMQSVGISLEWRTE